MLWRTLLIDVTGIEMAGSVWNNPAWIARLCRAISLTVAQQAIRHVYHVWPQGCMLAAILGNRTSLVVTTVPECSAARIELTVAGEIAPEFREKLCDAIRRSFAADVSCQVIERRHHAASP